MVNPELANPFAYFMLLGWAPFTLFLFATRPPARAATISALGGVMFLPELLALDAPMLPPFDKLVIPTLGCFIGASLWARPQLARASSFGGIERIALVVLASLACTVLLNQDPLPGSLNPPMRPYDIIAGSIRDLLLFWVPFHVARSLFRGRRDLLLLIGMLAAGGTLYSVFGLIELRLAPTLHDRTYGFAQHDLMQQIRGDGFRPMAFMSHGLNLSRFMLVCLLCATALARLKKQVLGVSATWIAIYLGIVLILFKSSGAIIWASLGVPLVLFSSITTQLRVAAVLGALTFLYPALRSADMIPTDRLVELATEHIDPKRGRSLKDRFDQENPLLDRAMLRPYFGWGANGRNRITNAKGENLVTTDGEWIIIIGERGIVGFLGYFSLLVFPVWAAVRARKRLASNTDAQVLAVLALSMALCVADNILNSAGSIPQFFFAGALAGAAEGLVREGQRRRARQAASIVVSPAQPHVA